MFLCIFFFILLWIVECRNSSVRGCGAVIVSYLANVFNLDAYTFVNLQYIFFVHSQKKRRVLDTVAWNWIFHSSSLTFVIKKLVKMKKRRSERSSYERSSFQHIVKLVIDSVKFPAFLGNSNQTFLWFFFIFLTLFNTLIHVLLLD